MIKSLIFSSLEESITLTYNFFNFDPEDPEITNFDVSPCFTSDKKILFKLTYSGR